jgi:hypothetical protein
MVRGKARRDRRQASRGAGCRRRRSGRDTSNAGGSGSGRGVHSGCSGCARLREKLRDARTAKAAEDLKGILLGIHQLGGLLAGIEELPLAEEEAATFAAALAGVASKRKVKIPPEALAWGNLAATALVIYTPRIIAYLAKQKASRADPRATPEQEILVVTAMRPVRTTGPN